MSKRGPYKLYYDRNFSKRIPRSTIHNWKRASKENQKRRQHLVCETDCHDENVMSQLSSFMTAGNQVTSMQDENISCEDKDILLNNSTAETTTKSSEDIALNINEILAVKKKSQLRRDKQTEKLQSAFCDCTDINVAEVLLLFLTVSMKNSLTWVALLDIFEILNYILKKNILPTTKYALKNLLNVNNESFTNHVMCSKCNKYVGKSTDSNYTMTCICGEIINSTSTSGSFFIQLNPMQQLQKLFMDPIIQSSLNERFNRNKINSDAMEDIFDGQKYKEYSENPNLLGNPHNFSFTFNTDGCKSSDNSKITIWPIFMMIHELPDTLRKQYMPLVGLWVAKNEPDMTVFLQPFVELFNELSTKGFSLNFCGKDVISKFFPIGCCVDSPARCAMLNMKRFNGVHGCTYCEHKTELVGNVRKYTRINNPPPLRTHDSIKQQMIEAYENDSDVMGVKGPSPLLYLKHFNLVDGMILDFMHSCLLGVTELHMTILMTNANEDYYIGSPANKFLINETLLTIKPPSCIARIPRNIDEINKWKASQWLSWLIFYSLICLRVVLPLKYYNHWALFVEAMKILLQDSITSEMLETAGVLLVKFLFFFEKLYGKQYMHYNLHLLLHLKNTVKNWGPLWADSTFAFENQNRLLLKKKV